ncbi:MAG: tight adherence protein [Actinomycetota bacterium]
MTGLLLALVAAYGVHLVFTSFALGWRGVGPGPTVATRRRSARVHDFIVQSGLDDTRPAELIAVEGVLLLIGAGVAWALFGGVVPPLAGALATALIPVAAARRRRERRRTHAREAWPRLIEEIRIRTTTLGRSIPQALFEVGERAPDELRPAFDAAHREWLLSTDFERTVAVLTNRLADATADAVCETLLVAHRIGGNDVDRCLAALIDDRILDLQGRKDADARQAGARFARRFTLIVPIGMAMIGLSIGDGRASYATPAGQILVTIGLGLMAVCWLWAGQVLRLPAEQRVFGE